MALVTIEEGSLCDSSIVNGNFESLYDDIQTLASNIEQSIATLTANMSSVSSSITSQLESFQETLESELENYLPLSGGTLTGSTYATTQSSSNSSTLLATTAFVKNVLSSSGSGLATYSKATNGYIKFANGWILQKGSFTSSSYKSTKSVSFPTSFSSTNYTIVFGSNYQQTAGDKGSTCSCTSRSTSSFTYYSGFEQSTPTVRYIAFGY